MHLGVSISAILNCNFTAERLQSELAERDKQSVAAASALACKVF